MICNKRTSEVFQKETHHKSKVTWRVPFRTGSVKIIYVHLLGVLEILSSYKK